MSKGRPVGKSDVLTKEELTRIMSLPDRRSRQGARDYAVLLVLCNTPMRKGEIVNLNTENLIDEGEKKYITYAALKKKSQRPYWLKIPIQGIVYEGVKRYVDISKENGSTTGPLFKTLGKHGPYDTRRITPKAIDLIVEKYVDEAGIQKRVTPHSFRATYATLRKHADPWTLQGLGGWASIASVMPYVREDEKHREEAALAFSFS